MSASFVSAMNTRADHFAIDEENKQLKKEIKESEAVEKHLMEILRRTNKYDEALKAHYREGKVVELLIGIPTWVDDDEEEESEAEEDLYVGRHKYKSDKMEEQLNKLKLENERLKEQTQNLWELLADEYDCSPYIIDKLIESFGLKHVKTVFKEDYADHIQAMEEWAEEDW